MPVISELDYYALFETVQAKEAEITSLRALLTDIREWLDGQTDADCIDGSFRPNQAMSFAARIDELLDK